MPTVAAGSAELYYEARGAGPPVLFIMGASGDARHFATVAEDLADEFTAVTYDRRGNSRSPRPPGWSATSSRSRRTTPRRSSGSSGWLRPRSWAPAPAGSSRSASCSGTRTPCAGR